MFQTLKHPALCGYQPERGNDKIFAVGRCWRQYSSQCQELSWLETWIIVKQLSGFVFKYFLNDFQQ